MDARPSGIAKLAPCDRDAPPGIVVGDELMTALGEQSEADRMSRPDAIHEQAGGS